MSQLDATTTPCPSARSVTPRRKNTLSPARILETAAMLADRDGFDTITLTRVADELGVQQPALYRHIGSADELTRLLGLLGRQTLANGLAQSAIGKSRNDAVAAVGSAWREVARLHPGLYTATDRYPCKGDEELEGAVDSVVGVLHRSLSAFDLTDEQRIHVARSLRSAFHGFAHLELGDGHPTPVDLDDSFAHLIELLCSGIDKLERKGSST